MRRRALLASVAALPAGCIGVAPPGSDGGTTPAGTPGNATATPPGGEPAEYRIAGLSVATSTEHPDARYVLEPDAFYSEDAVEREAERTGEEQIVRDVAAVEDPAVREAVETALTDGEWRSDALPDGLTEIVERVDFFTGIPAGDTHTHVGLTLHRLHPGRPPAVEFDAAVLDAEVSAGSPGALELALRNVGPEPREVFSGSVPPFGAVWAERGGVVEERFLLWRPYEEEGCFRFGEHGLARCDVGKTTPLPPGGTVTRRYEVLPGSTETHPEYTAPPGPGTYRFADSVSHGGGAGGPQSTLSFEVRFRLDAP